MITEEELGEMLSRAIAAKAVATNASDGPWDCVEDGEVYQIRAAGHEPAICAPPLNRPHDEPWECNGPFIASSRTTVPTLCGYVTRLVEEVRALRRANEERERVGVEVMRHFAEGGATSSPGLVTEHFRVFNTFDDDEEADIAPE